MYNQCNPGWQHWFIDKSAPWRISLRAVILCQTDVVDYHVYNVQILWELYLWELDTHSGYKVWEHCFTGYYYSWPQNYFNIADLFIVLHTDMMKCGRNWLFLFSPGSSLNEKTVDNCSTVLLSKFNLTEKIIGISNWRRQGKRDFKHGEHSGEREVLRGWTLAQDWKLGRLKPLVLVTD